MSLYDKLFRRQTNVAPDMEQALKALHDHAEATDPVGTIIWMNVDEDGNVVSSHKELPHQEVLDG